MSVMAVTFRSTLGGYPFGWHVINHRGVGIGELQVHDGLRRILFSLPAKLPNVQGTERLETVVDRVRGNAKGRLYHASRYSFQCRIRQRSKNN